jgi:predicted nucleotidyltransferase
LTLAAAARILGCVGIPERWRGRPPLPPDLRARLGRLEELFRRHGVRLAYLFGSAARGEAADDVDLALLVRQGSAHDLWPEVADALGTDRLDLVDLATASPTLRFRVVRDGRLLFAEDARTENEFEMAAIREYRDTAHRRRIQDAYVRRRAEP